MNNLLISYDLIAPGQNYDSVIHAIKSLGQWAKVQKSFWYVKSPLSAESARNALRLVLDKNDSLFVVDATHDMAAWYGLEPEVSSALVQTWSRNSTVTS